jgi:hypothetical protein
LTPPALVACFSAEVAVAPPHDLGTSDGARRRMVPILGGRVSGPRLNGEILPGGGDWQTIRADGTTDLCARYLIRAIDGTILSVTNSGYRHGPREILARIADGEIVDPALYYFRTTPRFAVAADSAHAWLGRTVMLCTAERRSDAVLLDFFAVE